MLGGRPPKPLELKRRTGNPGKRPLPAQTAALVPANGVPPTPITLGDEGRILWPRLWTAAASWLSPALDQQELEGVCHLADEIAEYRRVLVEYGLMIDEPIVTPLGNVVGSRLVANPAIRELRNAEKQLREYLSDLGFTPTARAHLGLAEVKRQSKLEELIAKRAGA